MLSFEASHLIEYAINNGHSITLGDYTGYTFAVKTTDIEQLTNDIHLADYCVLHFYHEGENQKVGWAHLKEEEKSGAYEVVDHSMTPLLTEWKAKYLEETAE